MRVVVTLPWARRLGGAEAMLQTLLDGVRDGEHEFELIFFEHGPWERELADAGFRTTVIAAGRVRELHRWLWTVLRLAALFRQRRPDIIVNWAAKTQLYGSPAGVLARMSSRVVWWQHMIPSSHWIDRSATALPARAIGCCSLAASTAQRKLRPSRATFVVLPGAPPPKRSKRVPADIDLPAGMTVVGLVGRLQPWKGQDRLLRAHALLRDEGHEFHTLLVGGDAYGFSSEYAESLPRLIDQLGLSGSVTMTGHVSDAAPYIDRMNVLVNASEPEPFGLVLLEGMARGAVVLAVDSGGPAEFIEHEGSGLLASSGDPTALANELRRLVTSPDLRKRLSRAGQERFAREFTGDAMCERFLAQITNLTKDMKSAEAVSAKLG